MRYFPSAALNILEEKPRSRGKNSGIRPRKRRLSKQKDQDMSLASTHQLRFLTQCQKLHSHPSETRPISAYQFLKQFPGTSFKYTVLEILIDFSMTWTLCLGAGNSVKGSVAAAAGAEGEWGDSGRRGVIGSTTSCSVFRLLRVCRRSRRLTGISKRSTTPILQGKRSTQKDFELFYVFAARRLTFTSVSHGESAWTCLEYNCLEFKVVFFPLYNLK